MAREKRIPYIRFYTTDWRGDVPLRMCSFAARGLWIDLLTLMHESDRPGYLLIAGQTPSARQLAALLGGGEKEITKLLNELRAAEIFDVDAESGAIVSRRMVRDAAKAATDRENGRGGGNPSLKATDKPQVGGQDNGGVNPQAKAHGFTISSSSKSLSPSTSVLNSESAAQTAAGDDDAEAIVRQFDESRVATFGEEQARPWRNQTDHVMAAKLIEAGATAALCRPVFDAVNAKLKAKGHKPRDMLSAMEGDVMSALAAKAKPVATVASPTTQKRAPTPDGREFNDIVLRVFKKIGADRVKALHAAYIADPVAGLAEARRIDADLRANAGAAA